MRLITAVAKSNCPGANGNAKALATAYRMATPSLLSISAAKRTNVGATSIANI